MGVKISAQSVVLGRVQAALRVSHDRYVELFDFAPVGYLVLNDQGIVCDANFAAADLLGLNRAGLVGKKLGRLISRTSQEAYEQHRREVFTTKAKQKCELTLQNASGASVIARLESIVSTGSRGGRQCLMALIDITESRGAEKSLKLFRALIERSNDAVEVLDPATGRFLDANAKAFQNLGYTSAEFLQLSVFDIAPYTDHIQFEQNCAEARKRGSMTFEDIHRRKDGSLFPVEISLSWIALDRPYMLAIERDITERKLVETSQRQMALRLVEVQELECARFSRELHDQTGQEIAALQLHLRILHDISADSPRIRERLTKMARLTDDLARSVHQVAWELRPSVLDDLGLSRALRRYLTGWSKMTQVPVDFQCSGLRGLKRAKPVVEITLYRIAQEALQNVWKHSRASRVSVLLQRRTEDVLLIVEDDGQGFNADNLLKDVTRRGQLGLNGMYERAALVGGNVAIESRPRKGTCIFVSIPLPVDLNVAATRQSAAILETETSGALPSPRYGSGVQSAKSGFGEFLSGKS